MVQTILSQCPYGLRGKKLAEYSYTMHNRPDRGQLAKGKRRKVANKSPVDLHLSIVWLGGGGTIMNSLFLTKS